MNVCTLTDAAKTQIDTICKENNAIAVTLNMKGGGCAGFEYEWDMVEKEGVEEHDEVIDTGEGNLVVSAHSLMYLFGSEIDYSRDVFQTQFVINNPNAQSACGCGISVNFNDNIEDNIQILELK